MLLGRKRPFNRTTFLGLALMAQANIARWVLDRHSSLPEDPRDAIVGLLYGLAIGCLLLGVWRMNRPHAVPSDRC
jgi:hypothetical protein